MATLKPNFVKLVHKGLPGNKDLPLCVLRFNEGQTLAEFRVRIESNLDFDFDFWDERLPGPIRRRAERVVELNELDGTVYVIQEQGGSLPDSGMTTVSSHSSTPTAPQVSGQPAVDECKTQNDPVQAQTPATPLKVSFESILMPDRSAKQWREECSRLQKWVDNHGYSDHNWKVRTWDQGTDVKGHLECLECRVPYGNVNNAQNINAIATLFSNFRFQHLISSKHNDNYCRRRGLGLVSDKRADIANIPEFDHEGAISKGLEIVGMLNKEVGEEKDVFFVPNLEAYGNRSFLLRVRCALCVGFDIDLCPRKANLELNLKCHLLCRAHQDALETREMSATPALRTAERAQPKKPDARDRPPCQVRRKPDARDLHPWQVRRKPDARDRYPSQARIQRFYKEDGSTASSGRGMDELSEIDSGKRKVPFKWDLGSSDSND